MGQRAAGKAGGGVLAASGWSRWRQTVLLALALAPTGDALGQRSADAPAPLPLRDAGQVRWGASLNGGLSRGPAAGIAYDPGLDIDIHWRNKRIGVNGFWLARHNEARQGNRKLISASYLRTRLDLQYDLTPLWFCLVFPEIERAALRSLSLRTTLAAACGRRLYRTPASSLDFFSGVALSRDDYGLLQPGVEGNMQRRRHELLLGGNIGYQSGRGLRVDQRVAIFPDMARIGEFRAKFDLMVSLRLSVRLQLKGVLSAAWQSHAPFNQPRADIMAMTSLGYFVGSERR